MYIHKLQLICFPFGQWDSSLSQPSNTVKFIVLCRCIKHDPARLITSNNSLSSRSQYMDNTFHLKIDMLPQKKSDTVLLMSFGLITFMSCKMLSIKAKYHFRIWFPAFIPSLYQKKEKDIKTIKWLIWSDPINYAIVTLVTRFKSNELWHHSSKTK